MEKELKINNRIEEIKRVISFIEDFGIKNGLTAEITYDLSLVVEECLSNIIFYAFGDENKHQIELNLKIVNKHMVITISDEGKKFNPVEAKSEPEIKSDLSDIEPGGLGIHLMKTLVDEVNYKRLDNKNILELTIEIK